MPRQSTLLDVPGAKLYYETVGTGPTLLMIPGGPQDAGTFVEIAAELSNAFTVVTYDPRGNSRTQIDGEPADLDMRQQAEDASALINRVGAPAFVFGTSGGGQIALELATRHPDYIRSMIVHEPPSMMLMPDPEPLLAADRALYQTYRSEDVHAAMTQFFAENGLGDDEDTFDPTALPLQAPETFKRVSANFEYWLAHGMLPLSMYRPDVEALRASDVRIDVMIGEASAGQPIEAMSLALADGLGAAPLRAPGDHTGYAQDPVGFAQVVRSALE